MIVVGVVIFQSKKEEENSKLLNCVILFKQARLPASVDAWEKVRHSVSPTIASIGVSRYTQSTCMQFPSALTMDRFMRRKWTGISGTHSIFIQFIIFVYNLKKKKNNHKATPLEVIRTIYVKPKHDIDADADYVTS